MQDFRTKRDQRPRRPSAVPLETIYLMQRRQSWMRDYLLEVGENPLPFIGTVTQGSRPAAAVQNIGRTLGIEHGRAERHSTSTSALLGTRRAVEDTGVLVVINGAFGNNTSQKLHAEEFRWFDVGKVSR